MVTRVIFIGGGIDALITMEIFVYLFAEVMLQMGKVGICGSDVSFLVKGRCGTFVVEEPLVLGHESAGTVLECGSKVNHLKPGKHILTVFLSIYFFDSKHFFSEIRQLALKVD